VNYDPGAVVEFDREKAFAILRQLLMTLDLTDKISN
jgi:hypothetical protein